MNNHGGDRIGEELGGSCSLYLCTMHTVSEAALLSICIVRSKLHAGERILGKP